MHTIKKIIKRPSLLAIVLVMYLFIGAISIFFNTSGQEESQVKATWVWDDQEIARKSEEIVSFANEQGVNLIYVHVSLERFSPKDYRAFIQEASQNDIQVFALGGDPYWALTSNQDNVSNFVSKVKNYNKMVGPTEEFQGIHVDIEPYLLPSWKKEKESVMEQWMMNSTHLIQEAKQNTNLTVSGDFPFWIHKLNVPGTSMSLSKWMLKQYDSITLMAYRNTAEGSNGISQIATPIVKEAEDQEKSVVIGVNMIDTDEGNHTTFYGSEPGHMTQEIKQLKQSFKGNQGFSGIAVHDYAHWKKEQSG